MWNLLLLLAVGGHPNRLLADGTLELNKLITDRPTLAPVLENHSSLRSWLVDAFDAKFSKVKISWRNDDTKMRTRFGEHSYDENGALIIISRKPSPFDQLT